MNGKTTKLILGCLTGLLISSSAAQASGRFFEVTITNLTRTETFTPILVASHKAGVKLFSAGSPASAELAALAEGGDFMPLAHALESNKKVRDVANSGGLLAPGASVTVLVKDGGGANKISVASMLIPTNDAFIALNGVDAPRGNKTVMYRSPAYDAGSEPNDELCISIPGPVCGGEGGSPGASGEGYVHIHGGIHGIGDLAPAVYDWRNPTARITIRRVKN